MGNRTFFSEKGNAHSWSYNEAGEITVWTYDAAGNLTYDGNASYTYDGLSRLTSVTQGGVPTIYQYNGDGVLIGQQRAGVTTTYVQDLAAGLSQVLEVRNGSTVATTAIYGLERLATLNSSGTRSWPVGDMLGTQRQLLDNTLAANAFGDATFTPSGQKYQGASAALFGFTGELQDASNDLLNLRARWYHPTSGTFLSRDPYPGWADTPASQTPYQYAYNDPIKLTDPSGMCLPKSVPIIGWIFGSEDCTFEAGVKSGKLDWVGAAKVVVAGAAVAATVVACGSTAGVACVAGSAVAGGVGSWGNQALDNAGKPLPQAAVTDINWTKVGVDSAIGGVSGYIGGVAGRGIPIFCKAGLVCTATANAVIGATSSGTTRVVQNMTDGKPETSPMDGIYSSALFGGIIGGGLTGINSWVNRGRTPNIQPAPDTPDIIAPNPSTDGPDLSVCGDCGTRRPDLVRSPGALRIDEDGASVFCRVCVKNGNTTFKDPTKKSFIHPWEAYEEQARAVGLRPPYYSPAMGNGHAVGHFSAFQGGTNEGDVYAILNGWIRGNKEVP